MDPNAVTPLDVLAWAGAVFVAVLVFLFAVLVIAGTIAGIHAAARQRKATKTTQILTSHPHD